MRVVTTLLLLSVGQGLMVAWAFGGDRVFVLLGVDLVVAAVVLAVDGAISR